MSSPPILEVNNLSKSFGMGRTAIKAVKKTSFTIYEGEIILIMGPSGGGKTTLLSLLSGLMSADRGEVRLHDVISITSAKSSELARVRLRHIGFIFQFFHLFQALTAQENITLVLRLAGIKRKDAQKRANQLLNILGLRQRKNHLPKQLSGGERQRVAIARAIANDPHIIFADEPTGNLDSKSGENVIRFLSKLAKQEGRTVVIVSHDERLKKFADRIFWMEDGVITEK